MTIDQHFIDTALTRVSGQIAVLGSVELCDFGQFDRYLALSALQKAIRRDEFTLAWAASSYLLENFPAHFWKRLVIIAFEDIGVADVELCLATILICSEENKRVELGGCLKVAFALVGELCSAKKDRCTDDLFDVVSRDPQMIEYRADLADQYAEGTDTKIELVGGGVCELASRMAVLAGYADEVPGGNLRKRVWASTIHAISSGITDPRVWGVAELGLQRTGSILAPMLAAVGCYASSSPSTVDDHFPDSEEVKGIPVWVAGMHTRVGLDGFRRYIRSSKSMSKLLSTASTGEVSKSKIVGALVFRLDCGQLRHRLDWSLADELKSRATELGWGLSDEAVPEALNILRSEYELLNRYRLEALLDYLP